MAAYATPEVRGLFEEWARVVEEEILAFIREKGSVAPDAISAQLNISAASVLFFIARMARAEKIVIGEVRIGQQAARP